MTEQSPSSSELSQECSRRTFLAQATVVMGGAVAFGLVTPLSAALWPKPELIGANKSWSPLRPDEFAALRATLDKPVRLNFVKKHVVDGYLVSDNNYFVWGVHFDAEGLRKFEEERPELFEHPEHGSLNVEAGTLGFVMFSSLCPHLNCKPDWDDYLRVFLCPCHGSQFSRFGAHMKDSNGRYIGPSPRGLDPVPFRERSGIAEVEWVKYASNQPSRIVVSYY